MQNWKLKRMSKVTKGIWLDAIDELVEQYKEDRRWLFNCPFCKIARDINIAVKTCTDCIWVILEDMECSDYAIASGFRDILIPGNLNYDNWKNLRLRMLRKWKKILLTSPNL